MMNPILPGSAIGVLGSGQLGRMFAIAARRMGYRVHTFSPDNDTPTGQVADLEVQASYDDLDAVRRFARGVAAVTFEFENVPAATAQAASECAPVRPSGQVLHITQHRLREKTFLREHGFAVTPFWPVRSLAELEAVLRAQALPVVLKTAGWGYDGKGQTIVRHVDEAAAAWQRLGTGEAIVEAFVDFTCECSVIAARGANGEVATYDLIRNDHAHHILDLSVCPSGLGADVERQAREIAHAVVQALDVVGVLCVEFFLTSDRQLLINELAPRPHNSGHLTFDACVTSQFEQQLRAVCGLPLGSTELLRPAAMANLLGDVWETGEPDWSAACAFREVKLHLYGKLEPRKARKMGHLTALAATPELAATQARAARNALTRRTST